jgi:hypothetical protein
LLVVSACAAIGGLSSIREVDCAPDCGAEGEGAAPPVDDKGDDGSIDAVAVSDSQSGSDADGVDARDAGVDQGVTTPDGASESGVMDASVDAPLDATTDAPPDATADAGPDVTADAPPDAPPDAAGPDAEAGCGPTTTVSNCGACGVACASGGSIESASCNGGSCAYVCAGGRLDCNASVSPDTDGCECMAPGATGCCGTGCPVKHSTGLTNPANFYDCVPAGTINSQLAQDACYTYVGAGNESECADLPSTCAGNPQAWCSNGAADCICWNYTSSAAGIVVESGGTSCMCDGAPGTASGTFD